jgi:hypothetical protein
MAGLGVVFVAGLQAAGAEWTSVSLGFLNYTGTFGREETTALHLEIALGAFHAFIASVLAMNHIRRIQDVRPISVTVAGGDASTALR